MVSVGHLPVPTVLFQTVSGRRIVGGYGLRLIDWRKTMTLAHAIARPNRYDLVRQYGDNTRLHGTATREANPYADDQYQAGQAASAHALNDAVQAVTEYLGDTPHTWESVDDSDGSYLFAFGRQYLVEPVDYDHDGYAITAASPPGRIIARTSVVLYDVNG